MNTLGLYLLSLLFFSNKNKLVIWISLHYHKINPVLTFSWKSVITIPGKVVQAFLLGLYWSIFCVIYCFHGNGIFLAVEAGKFEINKFGPNTME